VASVLVPLFVFLGACWYDRGVVLDQQRTQITATLDALAQRVRSMLRGAALALDFELSATKDSAWPEIRQSQEFPGLLRRLSDSLPEMAGAFLVDPDGVVAASSGINEPIGANVGDNDFFRQARADPDAIVMSPLTAPASGRKHGAVFVISRARMTNGRFDGVVAVAVWSAYFQNLFAPILDTQSSAIATLLRPDGTELFRHPSLVVPAEQAHPDKAAVERAALGPGVRPFATLSDGNGPVKIGAAEAIPGWGLTLVYGLDKQQMLRHWYEDIPFFAAIAAASALVLLFTARRAVLAEERRRRAEATLLQAGKMEALGRLTGGVAHDFNNLLAAILGSLELLRGRAKDPLDRQQLAIAERAAQRGVKLIGQMLAFARNSPVSPIAVDVNALVREANDLVRRTGGSRSNIEYDLQPGLWWALADPLQLDLSLLNLVANARDAMPEGGAITVRTRNLSAAEARSARLPERDHVILEVKDTGGGLTEHERNSAFDPFFTTKQPGKGTGLGLSMVYGFARQLGGTVTIDSRPGDTTVSICLPRTAPPANEASAPPHSVLAGADPAKV
jgi:signal transduction histidine kinase